ncbi:DivIVA domain-containing protein [Nocardia wallacei]|uniref:DivIVA domain-containing protein n=1 Tax=Nocardia wallacei TaxID=480035 RepID=UPI003CC7CEAC
MLTLLLYVLIVGLVAALLFLVASAVFGRGEELGPLPEGTTATVLPVAAISGGDVRALRFQQVFRGYKAGEVDWALTRLAARIDELEAQLAAARGDRPAAHPRTGSYPAAPPGFEQPIHPDRTPRAWGFGSSAASAPNGHTDPTAYSSPFTSPPTAWESSTQPTHRPGPETAAPGPANPAPRHDPPASPESTTPGGSVTSAPSGAVSGIEPANPAAGWAAPATADQGAAPPWQVSVPGLARGGDDHAGPGGPVPQVQPPGQQGTDQGERRDSQ